MLCSIGGKGDQRKAEKFEVSRVRLINFMYN
jgi:hypothetical protein